MATQNFPRVRGCISSLVVLCCVAGCSKPKTEPTGTTSGASTAAPSQPSPPSGAPRAGKPPSAGSLRWTMPSTWKEQPARQMRLATYQAAGPAGSAEVAVFYFGADQGGDVEANITRWVNQFKDVAEDQVRRDQLEVRGLHVSTVRVTKGVFASGMPGGPAEAQKDWGMNAAVVETPEGPYFFKMTGPAATVDAETPQFQALLESVQLGG